MTKIKAIFSPSEGTCAFLFVVLILGALPLFVGCGDSAGDKKSAGGTDKSEKIIIAYPGVQNMKKRARESVAEAEEKEIVSSSANGKGNGIRSRWIY